MPTEEERPLLYFRKEDWWKKQPYQGEQIVFEKDAAKHIGWITFNRPERLNAIGLWAAKQFFDCVSKAEEDDDVKVIIFKGAGRCFGTGMDVKDLGLHHGWGTEEERRPSQRERLAWDRHMTWGKDGRLARVFNCDKPTIAQVHGYAYGFHFELVQTCDMAIVSEDAVFTHPGYRYIGAVGNLPLLIASLGLKRAKGISLTGEPINAQEALAIGLVNKVAPIDKLEEETLRVAEIIAKQPRDALYMSKLAFEMAEDQIGINGFWPSAVMIHSLMTNIRYEPDEYNLFATRKRKGGDVTATFKAREEKFADAPMAKKKGKD